MTRIECLEEIADTFQSLLDRYVAAKRELNLYHGFTEEVTAFEHVQKAQFLVHKWKELRQSPDQYRELIKLLELYLVTDPNDPDVIHHYHRLCSWYSSTKGARPISEPKGVPIGDLPTVI